MSENEVKVCPSCGANCAVGAVGCSCGHVFTAEAFPMPPPVAQPVEAPPPVAPPIEAYPRPIYPPSFAAAPSGAPTMTERMIPTKNPKALIAYYCSVFSIVPCFTPLLGPAAIILGILGLQECKKNPILPGRGHAITGIVLGGIMTFLVFGGILFAVLASMNQPNRG